MNLYIYFDESGVFDNKHEKFFVFGGLIFLDKKEKDDAVKRYKAIEKQIRLKLNTNRELKANILTPNDKKRLLSSINKYFKFGIVIKLDCILKQIFDDKKSKQRYLDYAFKVGVKNVLLQMSNLNKLNLNNVNAIYVYCDEHTTATNGKYELKEALEQEFKRGTFNTTYAKYFPPITPNLRSLELKYCSSDKITLIRASDITANKIYNYTKRGKREHLNNIFIHDLP